MITADGFLNLLKRVASLRRAPRTRKGKYPAARSPYKPLLLLSVLRRPQQQTVPFSSNRIEYDCCLRDFEILYAALYGDGEGIASKATQAFWYLGAGTPVIWNLTANAGQEKELPTLISKGFQVKTPGRLRMLVHSASFSPADWQLVSDQDVQKALIAFLISEHFTDIRTEIARL
jgi:hypothetical protein